jgi:hypothetical protein
MAPPVIIMKMQINQEHWNACRASAGSRIEAAQEVGVFPNQPN